MPNKWKHPLSALVLLHTADLHILLLERSIDKGYWQSVTGSQEDQENLRDTACRELYEETGIQVPCASLKDWHLCNRFEIFGQWRHRYAPDVTHNLEHVFSLQIADTSPITLSTEEHQAYRWLPWQAAAEAVFSWTNRDAILLLAKEHGVYP